MTGNPNSGCAWRCSEEYVWRVFSDGRSLVVHERSGDHAWLNATATRFLELVKNGESTESVLELFHRAYRVGIGELERDLTEIAGELARLGILIPEVTSESLPGA